MVPNAGAEDLFPQQPHFPRALLPPPPEGQVRGSTATYQGLHHIAHATAGCSAVHQLVTLVAFEVCWLSGSHYKVSYS